MATVTDLYAELDGPPTPVEENAFDSLSMTELVRGDPQQVAEFDQNNEIAIQSNTDILINCLKACDGIVTAAYTLREYVPNTRNSEQAKFWKDEVIPNMLNVLSQDVKARSTLIHAYGAVRDLGIVIQKASEIVRATRGSPMAIEIAKKNIPAALAKLEEFIVKAEALDDSAINSFASDSKILFEIIGDEAGNFVKRRQEIEDKLDELYDRRNKLSDKVVQSKAEADRFAFLINATYKHLSAKQVTDEENKLRIEDLNQKNKETQSKIHEITTKITDSVTVKSRKKYWVWRKNKTTTVYEMSLNPDLDAERKYYESLIIARTQSIRDEEKNDSFNKDKISYLNNVLADYKEKYDIARGKVDELNVNIPRQMEELQNQIDALYKTLDDLDNEQKDVENKIGLSGSVLMECLINIHKYSQQIKTGATAYSPFVSILNGIKAMVQSDIELLSGTNTDIFIAGNRLTKFVGFISKYSVSSRSVLELIDEKREQLSITNN